MRVAIMCVSVYVIVMVLTIVRMRMAVMAVCHRARDFPPPREPEPLCEERGPDTNDQNPRDQAQPWIQLLREHVL